MIFWQKNVFSLVAKNDVVAFTRNLFMKKKKFLFLKIFVKPDFLGSMLGRKVDRNGGFFPESRRRPISPPPKKKPSEASRKKVG